MRGYPVIYLFAVALAACLSGCADTIQENEPHFSIRADLRPGWKVDISKIYRDDEPDKVFIPSTSAHDIWLQSGAYTAKIDRCNQQFNDSLETVGVRLGPDHLFKFSVQGHKRYDLYCATGPDGIIFVMISDWQIAETD